MPKKECLFFLRVYSIILRLGIVQLKMVCLFHQNKRYNEKYVDAFSINAMKVSWV